MVITTHNRSKSCYNFIDYHSVDYFNLSWYANNNKRCMSRIV